MGFFEDIFKTLGITPDPMTGLQPNIPYVPPTLPKGTAPTAKASTSSSVVAPTLSGLGSLVDKELQAYVAPVSSYTPNKSTYVAPEKPKDRYAPPDSLAKMGNTGFGSAVSNYLGRPVVPAEARSGKWDSNAQYYIPNSQLGSNLSKAGLNARYGNDAMDYLQNEYKDSFNYWNARQPWNMKSAGGNTDVGNWANAFIDAHADQGRLPTMQDVQDLAYSQANPGSGPNGAWTERDWIENWYAQNGVRPPADW